MNIQELLLNRGNEFEYALVGVGDTIEVVYFTRYELDGEVYYLESPCDLREIHQFSESDDIEKECIALVEDMLDDDVDRHQFFLQHIKPCIIGNIWYEIFAPQTAPFLPKEIDDIAFLSEEECVLYLLDSKKKHMLLAKYKLEWTNNKKHKKISEAEVSNFVRLNCELLEVPYVENVSFIDDAEFAEKYGEEHAFIEVKQYDSSWPRIFIRRSKLEDSVECFHNLAHEIRHYYQWLKSVDKRWVEKFNYVNEIDAVAYSNFTLLFLFDYDVWCEKFIDNIIDKSIEEINANVAARLMQIFPELMQRVNTMIGECL